MEYLIRITIFTLIEFMLYIVLDKYGLEAYFTFGSFLFLVLFLYNLFYFSIDSARISTKTWSNDSGLFVRNILNRDGNNDVQVKDRNRARLMKRLTEPTNMVYFGFLIINIVGYMVVIYK